MKVLVALVAMGFMASAIAHEMPTIYGKINKELRYVDQNSKHKYAEFAGVQDVDNSESRIGAKHNFELDGIKAMANLELGLNTTTYSGNTHERIRMRLAQIDLSGMVGTLTLGKAWTATGKVYSLIDPLAETGFGILGTDQSTNFKNMSSNLGVWSRGRMDLVGYATPEFYGIKFTTTLDRNDNNNRSQQPAEYWESLLSYKGDFGSVKPEVYVGYIKALGFYNATAVDSQNPEVYKTDVSMLYALNLGIQDFTLGALYQTRERELTNSATSTMTKPEDTWMTFSAKYNLGKNNIALTYATHDIDTKETSTSADKSVDTQIALGYTHAVGEHLFLRATVGQLEHEEKDATLKESDGNQGTMAALGASFVF